MNVSVSLAEIKHLTGELPAAITLPGETCSESRADHHPFEREGPGATPALVLPLLGRPCPCSSLARAGVC